MATARLLSQKEADIQLMCAAQVHLGTKNCNYQMERYTFKRRNDGNFPSSSLTFIFICHVFVRTEFHQIVLKNLSVDFYLVCIDLENPVLLLRLMSVC